MRMGMLLLVNQKAFSSWSMSAMACREGTRTVRFEVVDSRCWREAFWIPEGKESGLTHEPVSPESPAPAGRFFTSETPGKNTLTQKLYVRVRSSIIHHSQMVETASMSINRWINKENVIYSCREILDMQKEVLIHATAQMNIMLTTWEHHVKARKLGNKLVTTNHILYDFIYMNCPTLRPHAL